jgi:hypothetical protein
MSMNTVPLIATGNNSPKRLSLLSAPAASVMPLMALVAVLAGVALPPVLPAVLRPLRVVTPPTTGWAVCSVTV